MVYVTGSATTQFGELFDHSLLDLMVESVEGALTDSGAKLEDLDAIYISNMLGGALQNLQHLGSQLAGELKVNIPVYFYEAACASGGMAMHHAYKDVKAGTFNKVLVVGGEKMTELPASTVNQYLNRAASVEEQMTGISFCGLYALMAKAYLETHQVSVDDLAYGPALMHTQAADNPHAHFYHKAFTLQQIQQAREISAPLNLLHCSPLSDGASAVVLQKEPTKVQITGSSVATDSPDLGRRSSITSIPATQVALQRLNLNDDWRECCQLLELHDCFSIALVMALEDLGFCQAGQGAGFLKNYWDCHKTSEINNETRLAQKQERSISGFPEINASGGLKAGGHPVGATGVKQIHSLYQRLKEQSPGQLGLAQNIGGTGGTAILHSLESC